ncbi:hypothetical protein GN956_G11593 [Arapaima gigas]
MTFKSDSSFSPLCEQRVRVCARVWAVCARRDGPLPSARHFAERSVLRRPPRAPLAHLEAPRSRAPLRKTSPRLTLGAEREPRRFSSATERSSQHSSAWERHSTNEKSSSKQPATDVFLSRFTKQEPTSREERASPPGKKYKAKCARSRCKRPSICYQPTTPHGPGRFNTAVGRPACVCVDITGMKGGPLQNYKGAIPDLGPGTVLLDPASCLS